MTFGGMKLAEEEQSGERESTQKAKKCLCKYIEVDVECMYTKFDGRGLKSCGFFPFCLPTKFPPNFSFGPYQQNYNYIMCSNNFLLHGRGWILFNYNIKI